MCDLDYFKAYNDTYGHPAGDEALRVAAATFGDHLRSGDRVYRYGGEEFLVLLPEQGLGEATAALERVRFHLQALAVPHLGVGTGAVLTISAGLAASDPSRRIPGTELLIEADTALYEAKRTGRNRVVALPSGPPGVPVQAGRGGVAHLGGR
jgi:two-component system chemotaxis response regulator CheY